MKRVLVVVLLFLATYTHAQKPTQKVAEENNVTLREALSLQNEGRLAESNRKLTDLYALHYMTDYVCWNLAANYYNMKDYKRAERFASEAMSDGSQYVLKAGLLKAQCLGMRNKPDEEMQLLQNLAQYFPNEPSAHFALGACLWNRNKRKKANDEFAKAVTIDKTNPSVHLRIAFLNNEAKLYVQSFLAYYMYLFTNPVSHAREAISALVEIMNRRNVNAVIDELTADEASLSKEDTDLIWAMLFINELKTCGTDYESGLPDVDNFVLNSRRLLSLICSSIENREGFYEEFYVGFYNKLLADDMMEAFLYYCLANTYPDDINDVVPMTKAKMEEFADWLEKELK